MGFVQSSKANQQFCKEASFGTLPGSPDWRIILRTSIERFGNQDTYTEDRPVHRGRRRQSALLTSRRAPFGFEDNLRLSTMRYFLPGFLCCTPSTPGGSDQATFQVTAVTDGGGSADGFTVADNGDLAERTLVYTRGMANAENNGLFMLTSGSTTTSIKVPTATLVAEASVPTWALLDVAGYRGASGDLRINSDGDLTSEGAVDFTTWDLEVGQTIWIGGANTANKFATAADRGFAQVDVIAASKLTLSHRSQAFSADTGAGKEIDIYFGEFLRDPDNDDADYLEQFYRCERSYPNIGSGGETYYRYAEGLAANEWTISMPLEGIMTQRFGFVGKQFSDHTAAGSRATNASSPMEPAQRLGFSTAIHHMRLRLDESDTAVANTHFKTFSMTVRNNVNPSYYQNDGTNSGLAARAVNRGGFMVDVEAVLANSNIDLSDNIGDNTLMGFRWGDRNADGGYHVSLPAVRMTDGTETDVEDGEMTINGPMMAEEHPTLGYCIGVSLFPYLPES